MSLDRASTFTVTPFTRHSPECPKKADPQWKRCRCRKSLYIYEDGKVRYASTKTRSWEEAERVAQDERDKRDPVKIERAKIEAKKAAKDCSISNALDQWIARFKAKEESAKKYATFKKQTLAWANSQSLTLLSDVTADSLDKWTASWADAPNTQSERMTKVRSFFKWCFDLRKTDENLAVMLRPIQGEIEEETQPLTSKQFRELIAATHEYDEDRRVDKDRFGAELRAIFMVQRWTGVRLSDALMLRRSAVNGNRLTMTIQKSRKVKKMVIERVVPVEVLEALQAVPRRKRMHEDQFFWSRKCNHRVLAGMWTPRVRLLNQYLHFTNDKGAPMSFRSHMLRDTFAVELLLADVKLEDVSRLLCHSSVKITEKHYTPWVKARQKKLEDITMAAFRRMGAKFDGD
jgi:integrase